MSATKLARYWHTVRYLKPVQLADRAKRRLLPLRQPVAAPADLRFRRLTPRFDRPGRKAAMRQGGAEFFGRYHAIDFATSWDVADDDLWKYNLHYFDDLWVTGGRDSGVDYLELIDNWIDTEADVNGVGFAPYPTSLRIVNWCKYFWALPAEQVSRKMRQSLAIQAATLAQRLEYHLLANHLFANAKALVFAGVAFEGAFGERLLRRGLDILDRELGEQFLADGGHFELSPMYHNVLVWDVLDLLALSEIAGRPALAAMAARFRAVARDGVAWSRHMAHPDGEVAFFNDAAIGVAPTAAELATYAQRLDVDTVDEADSGGRAVHAVNLRPSGYAVVQGKDYKAILDLAEVGPPYQPGHAHADTLSFELSAFGRRCLVNTGVSTYSVGKERDDERATRAHNTVELDGRNSSDVWAGFRVARRAIPFDRSIECSADACTVKCAHSGYRVPPTNAVHAREWRFSRSAVSIIDRVTGDIRAGRAYFHFHPDCTLTETNGNWRIELGEKALIVESNGNPPVIDDYRWHEGFGHSKTAKRLVFNFEGQLTVTLRLGEAQ